MILDIIAVLLFVIYMVVKLKHDLHMLQQNSYRNERYLRWYKNWRQKELFYAEFLLLLPVVLSIFSRLASQISAALVFVLLILSYKRHLKPQKKALVMTFRAKRLYSVAIAIGAIFALIMIFAVGRVSNILSVVSWLLLLGGVIFSFVFLLLANILLHPVEQSINRRFMNEAKEILRSIPGLDIIAITGSFGKTSCKMILGGLISNEKTTLFTPGSFNTPLGITRVVRENLRPIHEVFIAEMGAKQKGDISELCDLVGPRIGILTAIGEQHLETFGNIQNIIDTKFELIEALPADGLAILNYDDENIRANIHRAPCRAITYGFDKAADYRAEDISYDRRGCSFTVICPSGETVSIRTPLLGRHNIYNILAGTACAHEIGLPLAKIAKEAARLTPVEHRLQLHSNPAGYNIIDDAFNANPKGTKAALEVLGTFTDGQKIIITPGMIELGPKEYELNFAFGQDCAKVCDIVILVGKTQTKPIQDGLAAASFPTEKYYVASDLNDARRYLAQVVRPGDTVLFENDLPDTYNE